MDVSISLGMEQTTLYLVLEMTSAQLKTQIGRSRALQKAVLSAAVFMMLGGIYENRSRVAGSPPHMVWSP
eukprot:6711443-Karenia_brevis.AAC.1